MARSISLAANRRAPFSFRKKLFGLEHKTTLSIYRASITLRDVFAVAKDTVSLVAAAGRVGNAVEAHRAPNPADLKVVGIEPEAFSRPQYRF